MNVPAFATAQAGILREVLALVNAANERVRHPIDLNYIAIPKNDWERIVNTVNRKPWEQLRPS